MFEPSSTVDSVKLQLKKHFVEELLKNGSYNFSDSDLDSLLQFMTMSNSSNSNSMAVDCGATFKDLAEVYAHKYHPYISIIVCTFGTVANILNIIVLTRKNMACAPINRILTALAVADMLVMLEYIPYAMYYYLILLKKRDFPYSGTVYMLFHANVTQILHTTSICLTLTLAIWRYLAIGYPHKSHIWCSDSRCTLGIILSYFLPIFLCAPTYFTTTIKSQVVLEDNETFVLYKLDLSDSFKDDQTLLMINFWIYAVFIKLLPCCILTLISLWLIRTLFKAEKRKQLLIDYDTFNLNVINRKTDIGRQIITRRLTKSERRADRTTKMLVAVLILFLITEFPQGIFALLIGVKGKDLFLKCYQLYGEFMDILALINCAINFILYCCMNRMFRMTFGELFKYKILAWVPALPSEVHTSYV